MQVDLLHLGTPGRGPDWPLGQTWPTDPCPSAVHDQIGQCLQVSKADAVLFWDGHLGTPDQGRVSTALERPGDLWHAGLRLGMAGLPGMLDHVAPTWMLNRDPDTGAEATSWRLSLRACLVRTHVLRQMGGIRPEFRSLAGAALEMGHRYVTRGAITRHMPWLVPDDASASSPGMPLEDELRFIYYRFGRSWSLWALLRSLALRAASPSHALRTLRNVLASQPPRDPAPYTRDDCPAPAPCSADVSVLIPTLDRYPYLYALLDQIRRQTIRPRDIIVVDQTARERRDTGLTARFPDLPMSVIYQDSPGQCTSRNAGLQLARGEYVLLLDDDVEIPPTLIETHLGCLASTGADASSGVADEAGAGSRPHAFTYSRVSDVFPAGNTLVRVSALGQSGLFDLAYDRGQRADGDLGMRVYLSGALMVLNPQALVFHHHAPAGGLRAHRARVVTYASSRKHILHRHLPSATEVYLAARYFSQHQVREMLWLRTLGTLSIRGGMPRKLAKCALSLLCLADTWRRIRRAQALANDLLRDYPQIPTVAHGEHASGASAGDALA